MAGIFFCHAVFCFGEPAHSSENYHVLHVQGLPIKSWAPQQASSKKTVRPEAGCSSVPFAYSLYLCLNFLPTFNGLSRISCCKMLNAAPLSTAWTFIILLYRWSQYSKVLNFSSKCKFSVLDLHILIFLVASQNHRISLLNLMKSFCILSHNAEINHTLSALNLFHRAGRKTGLKMRPPWWCKGRVKTNALDFSVFCFVLFCCS